MASTAPRSAPAKMAACAEPVMASADASQAGWAPVAQRVSLDFTSLTLLRAYLSYEVQVLHTCLLQVQPIAAEMRTHMNCSHFSLPLALVWVTKLEPSINSSKACFIEGCS